MIIITSWVSSRFNSCQRTHKLKSASFIYLDLNHIGTKMKYHIKYQLFDNASTSHT